MGLCAFTICGCYHFLYWLQCHAHAKQSFLWPKMLHWTSHRAAHFTEQLFNSDAVNHFYQILPPWRKTQLQREALQLVKAWLWFRLTRAMHCSLTETWVSQKHRPWKRREKSSAWKYRIPVLCQNSLDPALLYSVEESSDIFPDVNRAENGTRYPSKTS